MKKLLIFAVGLGIVLGTVSLSFGQDDKTGDKTAQKKGKKKKTDGGTEKKD